MALGNNYDNNEKKFYEPTVYSDYKMSNTEGIDPSALSISFFRGLLKLSISPKKQNTDKIAFDHDNNISVYLTHTKARMLASEIREMIANPNVINSGGVNTGENGLISFSNGKELGISNYCLIMRKINESGEVVSSYAYEFKTDYHYAIRNFDQSTAKFEKHFYNDIEIDQFLTLLEEYYKAMTGAIAYSVIDQSKYNQSRNDTKIGAIMEKLGISYEKPSYGGGNKSYFNNGGGNKGSNGEFMNKPETGGSMRQSTLDDLSNNLES